MLPEGNGTLVFEKKCQFWETALTANKSRTPSLVNCAVKTARTSQSQTDLPESKSRHADHEAMQLRSQQLMYPYLPIIRTPSRP